MKKKKIPAMDVMAAYEQAAMEIRELRRKGKPCHLEEHADPSGHRVEVVPEPPGQQQAAEDPAVSP